jgi:dipeptide/tripeptide permease
LLLPGHVQHIFGFFGFKTAVESVVGPLSTQALASQIFGLYSGFVYFTPLLGGMIADRWIGQRNAVVIGALSMSAGHIAMTFDQSFLLDRRLLRKDEPRSILDNARCNRHRWRGSCRDFRSTPQSSARPRSFIAGI